ncbi:MAG TPA: hypothetical protein P5312_09315 [Bacteroidales bacterium]|jgi:hypothetical protein|nr:hypothetical protein [Bacteroidales bacterium]HRT00226.1 hypothetical protein [Bacteroidales bacterium]
MKKIILFLVIISIVAISCKKSSKTEDAEILVEAYGDVLTRNQLNAAIPKNLSTKDSTAFAKMYIENWLAERLIFNFAKEKIKDTIEIHKKVEDYRRSLYVSKYEKDFIYSQVDEKVSVEEIEKYYNNHLNDYVLSNTYVKAFYLTMNADINVYYEVLNKVSTSGLKDKKALIEYCVGADREVFFFEEFIELREFLSIINYKGNFDDADLLSRNVLDFVVDKKRYIVKFDEYYIKGQVMPFELAKPLIYKKIINKRRETERTKFVSELMNNAKELGKIKYYYDKKN